MEEMTTSPKSHFHIEQSIHRFEIEGAEMVTDLWISSEKPKHLLVLLNGYQRPRLDFRAFRKKLHAKLPPLATLAIDLRGSGDTKAYPNAEWPPTENGISLLAREACQAAYYIADELALNTFSVLGISMGGMVAQEIVRSCPQVSSAILVSTLPKGSMAADVFNYSKQIREAKIKPDKDMLRGYFGAKLIRESPIFVDGFLSYIYKDTTSEKPSAQWQRDAVEKFDIISSLPTINKPILIIHGKDDKIAPLETALQYFSSIKNSKICLYDEIGHLILVEGLDKFVDDVANFMMREI